MAVDCVNPKLTDGKLDIEKESLVPSITFVAELLGGIECSMAECNEAVWDLRNHLQDAACVIFSSSPMLASRVRLEDSIACSVCVFPGT